MDSPTNVSEAREQAQEKAQEAAGQARDRLRTQIDERSTQAGERAQTQASDLRTVAQQLREQGKDQPAKIADQAADRVERVGGYLQRSDADRILHDIEDFGRRQPMAVMLGGLALGFAASRVLKASSQRRSDERYPGYTTPRAQIPATTSTPVPPATTVPPTAHPAPGITHPGPGTGEAGGYLGRPGVPTGGGVA